jgi:hypothetical protein
LGVVNKGDAKFQVDQMAFDAICNTMSADMSATLTIKPTAKDVWDCIKMM